MNQADIENFLLALTKKPGVYYFYAKDKQLLYVGKAKNLKARVSSYFRGSNLQPKVNAMVRKIDHIAVTITATEKEALLLEYQLIKQHSPNYNIVMKDDKSYPYLFFSDGPFAKMIVLRGEQKAKGEYFGPYPNVASVRQTLGLLQKLFTIRHCSDSFFKARSRPCLQYQIKRCSAPCVGYIDEKSYEQDIKKAKMMLKGQDTQVVSELAQSMRQASTQQEYEKAANIRDIITAIGQVREGQSIVTSKGDVDVIVGMADGLQYCVGMLMIRQGRMLGHSAFFPKLGHEQAKDNVLSQFIIQHYLAMPATASHPYKIVVVKKFEDHLGVSALLSDHCGHDVKIIDASRNKIYGQWLSSANTNANHALSQHLSAKQSMFHRFEALTHALKRDVIFSRIDCFDISHTQGAQTIGACVVCDLDGPVKKSYRRYNIQGHTLGDDYGAMRQALLRHYKKIKTTDGILPDIILIDGGKGQLTQAQIVCDELQLADVLLIAIAKGVSRKPGQEKIYVGSKDTLINLPSDSPALHLLQFIRDEAHRFAITGHRKARDKKGISSVLEQIPGLGQVKRRALLEHLGGVVKIREASIDALCQVPGIGEMLARKIQESLTDKDVQ
jgi:excinuclease ABC subunit C